MEAVLGTTRRRRAVVAPKAAAVVTAVVMMEKTMVIEAVVLSLATRTIVTTGRVVISIPTADVTTQRPCNVSTRTTNMAPTYGTGTFTNRPVDSPTRSLLGLAMVKIIEEANTKLNPALVAVEAVSKVVADIRAVAILDGHYFGFYFIYKFFGTFSRFE